MVVFATIIAVLSLGVFIHALVTAPVGRQDAQGFWSERKAKRRIDVNVARPAVKPAGKPSPIIASEPHPAFTKAA